MIKSKDLIAQARQAEAANLAAAFATGDEAKMTEALANFCSSIQDAVLQQAAQEAETRNADNTVLAQRGAHVLTSAEQAYYKALGAAAASPDPRMAITNFDVAMPQTIIDGVIAEIRKTHPLLDRINFVNTAYMTRIVLNGADVPLAKWGKITSKITEEITGALKEIDVTMLKLSAFMCISKDLVDLGPAWIDQYVRATLAESCAAALEAGAVAGTGKDEPIGMIRDISAEAHVSDGAYPEQTAAKLTTLSAQSLGAVVAQIARNPLNETKARAVTDLILVCNPFDYWEKIMPATTFRIPGTGEYVHDVLPIPADIYQSAALAKGKAVLGIASRYFAGLGTSKDGKIEVDDSVRFFEDERAYKIRLHGNARPMDEFAFRLLDISTLEVSNPLPVSVEGSVTTETAAP